MICFYCFRFNKFVEKHNYKELLSLPVREGEFYSFVISDVKNYIEPDFIQAK